LTGRGYIRKQACQGGWDWGEMALTAGIYKDIRVEGWSSVRLADWRPTQHHGPDGSVRVDLAVTLERSGRDLPARVCARLSREGRAVAEAGLSTATDFAGLSLDVAEPALWWPNGMGDQPLYDLEITVASDSGTEVDGASARLGLRVLELVREPDEWGTSFVFSCNGRRFFSKGSNVVPLDQHPTSRGVSPRYRHIVESARQANMNMLRVWGGGYYLHREFYDLCDEMGICVWQDMMFGCGGSPFTDPEFADSVVRETRDNARVLRHHACLALWCGNNELEMGFCTDEDRPLRIPWEDYLPFFDELIPQALRKEDAVTAYIPGSPHSGPGERKDHASPKSGDCHLWEIWFSEAPFENYRRYPHRFMSEFGYQSLPSIETLRLAGAPEDLYFNSPVLEFHQRSQPGMRRIMGHLMDYFRLPAEFEKQAVLSQLVHGLGLKEGIEYWRTTWPRCGGATYWQLNDVWPAPTWSSVDVTGRWKAVHYFVRRMFAPVLVLGIARRNDRNCEIHLVNDAERTLEGNLEATLADGSGRVLSRWKFPVNTAARALRVAVVDLSEWVDPNRLTDAALWLNFTANSGESSDNLVLLDRPKHLVLRDPKPCVTVSAPSADGFREVSVSVEAPALWVELSCGDAGHFEDNYAPVFPGRPWKTRVRTSQATAEIVARPLGF
jgi:beta-mannosidase